MLFVRSAVAMGEDPELFECWLAPNLRFVGSLNFAPRIVFLSYSEGVL